MQPEAPAQPAFRDPDQPLDKRVDDLIARLTNEEKISQMLHACAPIPRLGIPAYDHWNEGLHGVGRNGCATVFPQVIGLAATWDAALVKRLATAISDEARAKHHAALRRQGETAQYQGLTFWSPNINIFRDPRWGRGQETWGEDPVLTGALASAFVAGMQGDDPHQLKTAACAKHFAVHSGPEKDRHSFDAVVSAHDLWDTYLPAFEQLVREAKVEIVMGAYNRTLGEPCCASRFLLIDILRERWGFSGHVVSDCWALSDIHNHHRVTSDPVETAALALKRGCDLSCGCTFDLLGEALSRGLIAEADLDRGLARHLRTRFRLGLFDPPDLGPWSTLPEKVVGCARHARLAYEAALRSCVLLKNRAGILPLRTDLRSVYITGPMASSFEALLGNYHGVPARGVTLLEGLVAALPEGVRVDYRPGCLAADAKRNELQWAEFEAARCDVTIACLGLTALLEGEEGDAISSGSRGDREDVLLPAVQLEFLKRLLDRGAKVVVVLTGGSAMSLGDLTERVEAILWAGYPGQEGGRAVADLLLGRASPSGRLPVTFYKRIRDLPPFEDYSMRGRTHRWFEGEPEFPFGFGLGYARVRYGAARIPARVNADSALRVSVEVTNEGTCAVEEVVQVYLADYRMPDGDMGPVPRETLVAWRRIRLAPGKSRRVVFTIPPSIRKLVTPEGARQRIPESFDVVIGAASPHPRAVELGAPEPVRGRVAIKPVGGFAKGRAVRGRA
ncbi:MAG: glycoside hydrolase family 3 C-terminal domain-containing protein [Opitutaceae bacterium]|nr:glycoside hydrolase family 3 C-terminal domain-containing protein [Opitutaceae bacterium]